MAGTIIFSVFIGVIAAVFYFYPRLQTANLSVSAYKDKLAVFEKNKISIPSFITKSISRANMPENGKTEQAYFTYSVIPLQNNQYQIDIRLESNNPLPCDASDLILTYDNSISVLTLEKGLSFPTYPRLEYNQSSVTITGIAGLSNNNLSYGTSNTLFATLHVKKNTPNAMIKVNIQDTNVFFSRKSLFDTTRSFKQIEL